MRSTSGLELGHTVGFSAQRMNTGQGALNLGIGAQSGLFYAALHVHADYLLFFDSEFSRYRITSPAAVESMKGKAFPYLGFGIAAGTWLALRIPIGVQYTFREDPISLFVALVPLIHLLQFPTFGLGLSLGIRFIL